jgi:hypothetical protein
MLKMLPVSELPGFGQHCPPYKYFCPTPYNVLVAVKEAMQPI